jgi:hypothetical protein
LLKDNKDVEKAKEKMQCILTTAISDMSDKDKKELQGGFGKKRDSQIAKKITNQILKGLNISRDDRKPSDFQASLQVK